jgi:hypothetical protein
LHLNELKIVDRNYYDILHIDFFGRIYGTTLNERSRGERYLAVWLTSIVETTGPDKEAKYHEISTPNGSRNETDDDDDDDKVCIVEELNIVTTESSLFCSTGNAQISTGVSRLLIV